MRQGGASTMTESEANSEPTAWARDAVFYGIDIPRFLDTDGDGRGDLPGVTAKLDYLAELGVTCLWLLPFFPSDRGDNGYAITDYIGVDARFGTIDDFRTLAAQAHRRGIRLMLDLVVHHTSSKHPWFQAAESDENSRYRDYYVWSHEKPQDDEWQSVFPHEEDGIWDYSERAGEYYRHLFYSFQPDLRLDNDEVWDNVKRIMDFWISVGADAFRIDAATLMFAEDRTDRSRFDQHFDDLRHYLKQRQAPVALLGEADVPPSEVSRYFEAGRFDLLYNFVANNAIYLTLARESVEPLAKALSGLRETAAHGAMLNFMRNLDELDLGQLSDDERREVFDAFAPEENMQIYGRGLRRGWAPMMRNDAQLQMTMSLLFALPGVPLLMYGQEIGIGDDLTLEGRQSVRLPMQWNSDACGGFTSATDSQLGRASHKGGDRGYATVNVERQSTEDTSLLALVRALSALRHDRPNIGKNEWEQIDAHSALFGLRYRDVVVIHNLSGAAQALPQFRNARTLLGCDLNAGELPAYGFGWAAVH
jgi:maltose alpha-D-glucosyltransferase/alpha-amylase